jgi:hypothetical protein
VRGSLLLGKLKYQGRLNAVVPGDLIYVNDTVSKRRYLVDTGASFSVLPYFSNRPPTGPRLAGPNGRFIPCWGYRRVFLIFGHRCFVWYFLLAAVKFPIIGVDFLRHFRLLIAPAGNKLVDSVTHEDIAATAAAVEPSTAATAVQVATCGNIVPPADKQVDWASTAATATQVATCGDSMRPADKLVEKTSAAAVAQASSKLPSGRPPASGSGALRQRLSEQFPDVLIHQKCCQ